MQIHIRASGEGNDNVRKELVKCRSKHLHASKEFLRVLSLI